MKTVYICGPMTGLARKEYLARFAEAARLLECQENLQAVSPARFLVCRWPLLYKLIGYRLTLLYDLWRLSKCNHIYKMPGWRDSHGANIESCWAYHSGVYTLPVNVRLQIDREMEKFINKMKSDDTD